MEEKLTNEQLEDEIVDTEMYIGELEAQLKAAKRKLAFLLVEDDFRFKQSRRVS